MTGVSRDSVREIDQCVRGRGQAAAFLEPKRRARVALRTERGPGRSKRTGHDNRVARDGSSPAGHPLGTAERGHAQHQQLGGGRIAADHWDACLGEALIQLDYVGDGRIGSHREADDQALRLRSRGGEIAEVDRRGAEAEVAPRDPVEPEVHALDERVLRDDPAAGKLRRVVLDPPDEPAALELREQPELTQVSERSRIPRTSTGPSPAPISTRPFATARDAASAAPRAASSRVRPRASSAASVAEWVQPAPWVAATSWRSTGISMCLLPSKRWSTARRRGRR